MSKPVIYWRIVRKCKLFVFNVSTNNSVVESLAWIIFPEICSDKSWKLTEIFYFHQIDTGIKIFDNKKKLLSYFWFWVYLTMVMDLVLVFSNGEEWRQQRKFMAKILLGAVQMTRYVPVINKVLHYTCIRLYKTHWFLLNDVTCNLPSCSRLPITLMRNRDQ